MVKMMTKMMIVVTLRSDLFLSQLLLQRVLCGHPQGGRAAWLLHCFTADCRQWFVHCREPEESDHLWQGRGVGTAQLPPRTAWSTQHQLHQGQFGSDKKLMWCTFFYLFISYHWFNNSFLNVSFPGWFTFWLSSHICCFATSKWLNILIFKRQSQRWNVYMSYASVDFAQ